MKKLIYLIVLIVALGLIVSGCIPVVPPVEQDEPGAFPNKAIINVNPGDSIQAAINLASDYDTINVAEGTYTENITLNKDITLLGANVGVDPAGDTDRGGESVIVGQVKITADGATVNGFKLTSSYICAGYTSALNVNISYNILENVLATWGAIHLHGNHQCDGAYVGYNTISGAVGDGIWTEGNDDVTIEYNHILSSSGFASIQALNHVGTGIVIHGNTITNSGGKGINYWAEDGGLITDNVITNSTYESIFTDAQATISSNHISGGDMYGILVYNGADGSTVSGNTISNTSWEGIQSDVQVTITNNDISGGYNGIQLSNAASFSVIDGNNIHNNQCFGLSIYLLVTDVTVQNNQFADNPYCGVIVWGDGEGSSIYINFNGISGNGIYGVYSERTTSYVDAENNWWGNASGPSGVGPGTGDAVSSYVDYDPWLGQDGFVTGGGWIYSPAGAYLADLDLEGKATFGFISKYKKGASAPVGNTQFNFQVADLNFHSDSYDWLVITGGQKAMYKGTGTVNGADNFGFMLSAIDDNPDMFRIKIWDKGTDTVIYDNQVDGPDGTVVAGGQIVIHKGK